MPAKGWKRDESIVGREYGKWRVLSAWRATSTKSREWLCVCACGTFRVQPTQQITRAAKTVRPGSCGCNVTVEGYPSKRVDGASDSAFKFRYDLYRRRAKSKLRCEFALTLADFAWLTQRDCHYCGSPPAMPTRYARTREGDPLSNGIDRVDNARGYLMSNCVPCCSTCNEMKLDRSAADFIAHVKRIAIHN